MKTADAVAAFLEDCEYSGLATKSIQGYEWALKKLVTAFPDEFPAESNQVKKFLIKQQGLNQESRYDLWRRLCRLWRWMGKEYKTYNIMVDDSRKPPEYKVSPPRRRRLLPRTLEDYEIDLLLDRTEGRRDKAMIQLIMDTGIRIGELAALRWPDVTLKGIRVPIQGKTGQRVVPISSTARQMMVGLGDSHNIWLGPKGPLTTSGCQQAIRRAMYNAGFAPPKAGPHMLRHTFGREWITLGGNQFALQRIFGHSTLSTTSIYVTLSTKDLEDEHAKFSPLRARADRLKGRQLRLLEDADQG